MENINLEKITEYVLDDMYLLRDLVNEVYSWNGDLEDYIWYSNDEYFYDEYFKDKMEVARAVYYGGNNYNYMDEYVKFDPYGNLETAHSYRVEDDLKNGVEEILEAFIELYKEGKVSTYDSGLIELLEESENE